ncbi:hypothetical protein QTP88_024150 [Uroleucon formosanum]
MFVQSGSNQYKINLSILKWITYDNIVSIGSEKCFVIVMFKLPCKKINSALFENISVLKFYKSPLPLTTSGLMNNIDSSAFVMHEEQSRSTYNIIILAFSDLPVSLPVQILVSDCSCQTASTSTYYITIIVMASKSIIELRHTNPNAHSNHVLNRNVRTRFFDNQSFCMFI